MEIGISVLWLVLCYAVAAYAGKKGRSAVGFFLLSLFLSPLIGFLFVAASPTDPRRLGLNNVPSAQNGCSPVRSNAGSAELTSHRRRWIPRFK
jgi:hypothetical protein